MTDADPAERPLWRKLLFNRFVATPAAILVAILLWNLFVMTHDNGVVAGRVLDSAGRPVEGANVELWALQFTTYAMRSRTSTDRNGRFLFTDNASHNIQLSAEKPGVGAAPRRVVRLYFRAQDIDVGDLLRLFPAS